MAMKILSTRLLASNLPLRVCVTSNAHSMSSSSSSSSSQPTSTSTSSVSTKTKKRESFRSMLASIFGGYVDPANPNDPPIPSDKVDLPDVTEQATGEAKLFLLAFENGILDPYCTLPVERKGRGTKDNPVLIESFINERLVACICESSQNFVKYTTVYENEPKRCQCGHWMKLVPAPKFWEKIPREDLVTIPFFKEMQLEGKLDALLSGELDKEQDEKNKHHH